MKVCARPFAYPHNTEYAGHTTPNKFYEVVEETDRSITVINNFGVSIKFSFKRSFLEN